MPRDQEKNEPNTQKTVIASNHLSSRRAKLKSNRTLHHESERPEGTANLRQKKQPSSNGRHQDDEQPISSIHHVLQPLDEQGGTGLARRLRHPPPSAPITARRYSS